MAVTLAAALLTGADPRPVQVVLNGTTAGQSYQLTGTAGDGSSWLVPGGTGISAGTQITLIDNRTALNTPITYEVVVDGVTYAAAPVTVVNDGVAVLQTIDGLRVVGVDVASTTEARQGSPRVAEFEIAGRTAPASRHDVAGSPTYEWQLETEGVDSAVMEAILMSGLPVVRRLEPGLRDLKTVVLGLVKSWKDELLSDGGDTWRRWTMTVREIPDPQPSTPLIAFIWDDFDAAMADRVWGWHTEFPSTSGWAATNGTLSNPTSGGYLTPRYLRASATSSATAVDIFESAYTAAAATLGEAVTAATTYTVTFRIKGTVGRSGMAAIKWSNGTIVTGAPVTLDGTWQQVSITATAPGGVTGLALGARMAATGVVSGNLLEISAPTVSKGAVVPVGTFDELFTVWDDFDAADWSLL